MKEDRKAYDVVALGELLIDFTEAGRSPDGRRLFEQNPGGAVANVACGAARLGLKTAFVGKVGADMHGRFLAETLRDAGVDISGLSFAGDTFTTLAFVSLSADGEREFSFSRKPGADTRLDIADIPLSLLENCRVLHVGSLSMTDEPARSATLYAVKKAKECGAIISYDPNYRAPLWHSTEEAKTNMRALLRFADIVKISQEETLLLTDEQEPDRAIDVLLASGVRFGIVTLGREGAAFGFLHGRGRVPTFENAPVTDTTGAGDAFLAAFLSRLLKEGSLGELSTARAAADIRFANAAATLCVGKRGAIPAMPFESQIDAFLAQARHEERADHSASVP